MLFCCRASVQEDSFELEGMRARISLLLQLTTFNVAPFLLAGFWAPWFSFENDISA